MPLTRATMTAASRIMLPTYPVFAGVVGLNLALTPRAQLRATPSFDFADRLVPLPLWGLVFVVLAVLQALALVLHDRRLYQWALGAFIGWLAIWALLCIAAWLRADASPTAWIWPAFVARACWASVVSLEVKER